MFPRTRYCLLIVLIYMSLLLLILHNINYSLSATKESNKIYINEIVTNHHQATATPKQYKLFNLSLFSSPFYFTCLSFPKQCKTYSIYNNIAIGNDLDLILFEINNSIFMKKEYLSPLFLLSLRREFIAYSLLNNVENKTVTLMFNVFQSIHFSDFHFNFTNFNNENHDIDRYHDQYILFHHHISKCAGTSILRTSDALAKKLNIPNSTIKNNLQAGAHMFDISEVQNYNKHKYYGYESCNHLYQALVDQKIYKYAVEIPLNKYNLCTQMYNAIVLRNPIKQFLSLLAHKINQNSLKILCKYQKYEKHFPGDINFKFKNNSNSYNYNYNRCRYNISKIKGIIQSVLIDKYYEPENKFYGNNTIGYATFFGKNKEFGIYYESNFIKQYIKHKIYANMTFGSFMLRRKIYLNATQLNGWMSNTFTRHLGYNTFEYVEHGVGDMSDVESMYVDPKYITNNHLLESKRNLLKYDYVLTMDSKMNGTLFDFFIREMNRIFLQTPPSKKNDTKLVVKQLLHSNAQHGVTKDDLWNLFQQNKELDVLFKYNTLDLELLQFAKGIGFIDRMFYDIVNQSTTIF